MQDVVAHITSTDRFWAASVNGGVAGTPTRFLAGFDPKATPAALVDAVRDVPPDEALAGFVDATEALCGVVESLDDAGWHATAESPAGHVGMSAVLHHALWDAWIHERDILLPLGTTPPVEPDEVLCSLRYAAALSPGFALQADTAPGAGVLGLEVTAPDASIVVAVGDHVDVRDGAVSDGALVLRRDAVELLEALSVRVPLTADVPPDQAWLLSGLRDVFEASAI